VWPVVLPAAVERLLDEVECKLELEDAVTHDREEPSSSPEALPVLRLSGGMHQVCQVNLDAWLRWLLFSWG
jgi:hypothetical protein